MYQNEETNFGTILLTKWETVFVSLCILFLFYDPVLDTTLYLVNLSPDSLPNYENFLDFPCLS